MLLWPSIKICLKMKWKRFLLLVAVLLIPTIVFIVNTQNVFMDILATGNSQRSIFADAFGRIFPKSSKATVHYQTTAAYKASSTVTPSCSVPNLQTKLLSKGTWLPVNNKSQAFVFSAYFVKQKSGKVVIVGMTNGEIRSFFCKIWYEIKDSRSFEVEEIPAQQSILPEGHSMRYSVALFECPVSTKLPSYVSLLSERCQSPLNLILVQHLKRLPIRKRNFTVCLPPLHTNYSGDIELVEWIELNRILGADKFIVYNISSASNVERILDFYSKQDLVETVQFDLPVDENGKLIQVHYFGQVAALNDCLYRNKYQTDIIVILDLDEFIIPHSENVTSWYGMIDEWQQAETYIFKSTFFRKEWDSLDTDTPNKTKVDMYRLITLQKVQRENKIFSFGTRTKYFTRPENISSVMIHSVNSKGRIGVPSDIALVHHYRDLDSDNNPRDVKVIDKTVSEKFGQELLNRVETVWYELEGNKTN